MRGPPRKRCRGNILLLAAIMTIVHRTFDFMRAYTNLGSGSV